MNPFFRFIYLLTLTFSICSCGKVNITRNSTAKPMEVSQADPGKSTPQPVNLDPCFALEAKAPSLWPELDGCVYLLPDREPISLTADLKHAAPLPEGYREKSRELAWTVSGGELKDVAREPGSAKATWVLPEGSSVLQAKIQANTLVESPAGPLEPNGYSRVFRYLSPLSSSHLIKGKIDGYNMGEFPNAKNAKGQEGPWIKSHADRYQLPKYFYRVDKADKPLKISPHLTLGHFTIDYPWRSLGMPQYVTIDMNLVEKLEDLITMMNQDGHKVTGLTPIYGFRSPHFNRESIEERPKENLKVWYSMHQYGRALDFIIDEDGDLVMDDLNGDGKHDIHDAAVIMHYVNILDRKYRDEKNWAKVGGAGLYTHHDFEGRPQSPYIHVDTRGFLSSSGTLVRWPDSWPDGSTILFSKI